MGSLLYRHPISKRKDSELDIKSEVIFRGLSLSAFVLDYQNFRVFAASQKNNTILEVSLDGTSVKNFRSNTQQPFLNIVNSLAYLNGKFFWTNSLEVFSEELNGDVFYHNSYAFFSTGSFDHLLAVHKSGQPVPVPLNPPLNVQVLFTKESANIIWKTPQTPALMVYF
ncbi:hypothetical protein Avbf_11014 [Armadillidium vulgare]|nr:hypothetical protein Avbf_11014 [Armadillidium vulgare]